MEPESGLNSLISMSNEENVPQTWLPASVRDSVPQRRIPLPSGVKLTIKINHDTHLKTEAKERSPTQPENDNDTLKQPGQLPWGLTSPYDGMPLVPFRVQRELCSTGRRWPEQMTSPRATFPQTPAPTFSLFILKPGFRSTWTDGKFYILYQREALVVWGVDKYWMPLPTLDLSSKGKKKVTRNQRDKMHGCHPRREPRRGVNSLTSFCLCLVSN